MAKGPKEGGRIKAMTPAKFAAIHEKEREADLIALALFVAPRALRSMRGASDYIIGDIEAELSAMELLLEKRYPRHLGVFRMILEEQHGENADVIDLFEYLSRTRDDRKNKPAG